MYGGKRGRHFQELFYQYASFRVVYFWLTGESLKRVEASTAQLVNWPKLKRKHRIVPYLLAEKRQVHAISQYHRVQAILKMRLKYPESFSSRSK